MQKVKHLRIGHGFHCSVELQDSIIDRGLTMVILILNVLIKKHHPNIYLEKIGVSDLRDLRECRPRISKPWFINYGGTPQIVIMNDNFQWYPL